MRRAVLVGAGAGLASAVVLAGCGQAKPSTSSSSSPSTVSPSSTTTASPGALPTVGRYGDGVLGGPLSEPGYELDVTTSSASQVSGTITYHYQDGRTSSPETFTGTAASGRAMLTLGPNATTLTATYSAQTITLENCTTYLTQARASSQCTFMYGGALTGAM